MVEPDVVKRDRSNRRRGESLPGSDATLGRAGLVTGSVGMVQLLCFVFGLGRGA